MNNGWIKVSPEWLQKKKEKLGLTFEAMSRITQIDRSNMFRYCKGDSAMSLSTKKKIYTAFKLYENS